MILTLKEIIKNLSNFKDQDNIVRILKHADKFTNHELESSVEKETTSFATTFASLFQLLDGCTLEGPFENADQHSAALLLNTKLLEILSAESSNLWDAILFKSKYNLFATRYLNENQKKLSKDALDVFMTMMMHLCGAPQKIVEDSLKREKLGKWSEVPLIKATAKILMIEQTQELDKIQNNAVSDDFNKTKPSMLNFDRKSLRAFLKADSNSEQFNSQLVTLLIRMNSGIANPLKIFLDFTEKHLTGNVLKIMGATSDIKNTIKNHFNLYLKLYNTVNISEFEKQNALENLTVISLLLVENFKDLPKTAFESYAKFSESSKNIIKSLTGCYLKDKKFDKTQELMMFFKLYQQSNNEPYSYLNILNADLIAYFSPKALIELSKIVSAKAIASTPSNLFFSLGTLAIQREPVSVLYECLFSNRHKIAHFLLSNGATLDESFKLENGEKQRRLPVDKMDSYTKFIIEQHKQSLQSSTALEQKDSEISSLKAKIEDKESLLKLYDQRMQLGKSLESKFEEQVTLARQIEENRQEIILESTLRDVFNGHSL